MVALLERPSLRLADSPAERRESTRRPVHGVAMGRRLDHCVEARQHPKMSLRLQDLSVGGLAAVSDVPVLRGERLAVQVPRQGFSGGWDACGRVVRCEPAGMGYRVAIEFEPLYSAA